MIIIIPMLDSKQSLFQEIGCGVGISIDLDLPTEGGNISHEAMADLLGKKPAFRGFYLVYQY